MERRPTDDDLLFGDAEADGPAPPPRRDHEPTWTVLVVDDDAEVHQVTEFALRPAIVDGRRLHFVHAASGAEAKDLLDQHPDAAVLLLDVVMESDGAGLDLVKYLREQLGYTHLRIILRTGQPGIAPEDRVMAEYDINDYREKTDLTAQQLRTCVTSAVRGYRDLRLLDLQRSGLARMVEATGALFEVQSLDGFIATLLPQLSALLVQWDASILLAGPVPLFHPHASTLMVQSGSGRFEGMTGKSLRRVLTDDVLADVWRSLEARGVVVRPTHAALGLARGAGIQAVLFIEFEHPLAAWEEPMLELYATTAAIALENQRFATDERTSRDALEQQLHEVVRVSGQLRKEIALRHAAEATRDEQSEALRQAQKLDALGRLAGGVAHDFNNILSVILSYAALAKDGLRADDPLLEDLTQIENAGRRASDLTRQLLAFGRRQVLHPCVLDLNDVVRSALPLVSRLVPESIEIMTTYAPRSAHVLADSSQLVQVLLNLCANARDAMPANGRLTISIAVVPPAAPDVRCGILLSITDTGTGMDEATRARIFEPFFTTKEVGKGTGRGLATVFGIVQQSEGTIDVETAPGHGTTFRIWLPERAEPLVTKSAKSAARRTAVPTGTVLLVEDDVPLCAATAALLRRAGFDVLTAPGPHAALDLVRARAGDVELLVTDVVMPGMNGLELVAAMRELIPGLRVIALTGYVNEDFAGGGLPADTRLLPKPLSPDELIDAVAEELGHI